MIERGGHRQGEKENIGVLFPGAANSDMDFFLQPLNKDLLNIRQSRLHGCISQQKNCTKSLFAGLTI